MASDDPDFEAKAADIIGLYLDPPQHAAVFCVDEKSAMQALDRLDPVLPLSPGRVERHGFEYYRHGTLSLYAALDVKSGKVHGKTAARHTSEEFRRLPRSGGRTLPAEAGDSHHCRQPPGTQSATGPGLLGIASASETAFHAHLLLVAESGGDLVCASGTRSDRPRSVHVDQGPGSETHALHPGLREERPAFPLEVLRCQSADQAMLTNS